MKAVILTVFAIILLSVVLIGAERLGYLAPSQEPEAYSTRLKIAEEIANENFDTSFGPTSKTAASFENLIQKLEAKYLAVVKENEVSLRAIHDEWRKQVATFARDAHAHFFARNFTVTALVRMRDHGRPNFPDLRALTVWMMRRHELEPILKRSTALGLCLLFRDVIPEHERLGVVELGDFDAVEVVGNCETLFELGYFDPRNAAIEHTRKKE